MLCKIVTIELDTIGDDQYKNDSEYYHKKGGNMLDHNLYRSVIDSMSAHVAILDGLGVIIETNHAWQKFAMENGMKENIDSVGVDYLSICEAAGEQDEDDAKRVAQGIRKVLHGDLPGFLTHYPCHSPDRKRWFTVRAVPFRDEKMNMVIVTHEDLTPIIEIQ